MPKSRPKAEPLKRKRKTLPVARREVRDLRREQLIEAAIKAISKKGIAETTVADVVKAADMANGAVNQYFDSKDTLLAEALKSVTGEFKATWQDARDRAGDDPAERLQALLLAQFDPRVCTRERISVWVAYWSEVRFRPRYLELCNDSDRHFFDEVALACQHLTEEHNYKDLDWRRVSRFLAAACDGLWVDMLLGTITREEAAELIRAQLNAVFPRSY